MNRYFGDRKFYGRVFAVMVPILIQNVITNFVSLLDNIMVGQVGTEPMSGVAIVNQLLFVFNITVFGMQAGAGIYAAQFHGKGDSEGVADSFRIKLWGNLIVVSLAFAVFLGAGPSLIDLFLHEGEGGLDLAATHAYAMQYLAIILIQIVPFALSQTYSGTLRETGETRVPMISGVSAVFVNLIGNYTLIYGKFGAPALGIRGAAIATVASRFVELAILAGWTHTHAEREPFIKGIYRRFTVPGKLVREVAVMSAPMFANELLWAAGTTLLNQCMSLRGIEVVSALNIANTVNNLFSTGYFAMGTAISIMVGQILGFGDLERAVDEDRKMIVFTGLLTLGIAAVMYAVAPIVPELYNTTVMVKGIARDLIRVIALLMPVEAMTMACYFTMRSGGKTVIVFLFDSVSTWVFNVPIAYFLGHYTAVPIVPMYALVYGTYFIKLIIGVVLVKKRAWVNNLV